MLTKSWLTLALVKLNSLVASTVFIASSSAISIAGLYFNCMCRSISSALPGSSSVGTGDLEKLIPDNDPAIFLCFMVFASNFTLSAYSVLFFKDSGSCE